MDKYCIGEVKNASSNSREKCMYRYVYICMYLPDPLFPALVDLVVH